MPELIDPVIEGRALVKAIAGLMALVEARIVIDQAEKSQRLSMLKLYQRRLRILVARLSPEVAQQILTVEAHASLTDFNLN